MTNNHRAIGPASRLIGLVLAFVVVTTAATRPAGVTTYVPLALQCPAQNASADTTIRGIKAMLIGTSPDDSSFRTEMGLVGVDSSALTVVTDSLVCTRVTNVIDSVTAITSPGTRSYFVVKAAARYIAFANLVTPREPSLWFLDTTYTFLGVMPY